MGRLGIWQKELPCLLKARVRPAFTGQDCTEPQTMRREFLKRMIPKQMSMRQTRRNRVINYDSIFVPEEPKRVVTASGKVIETETELLQKKD